MNVDIAPFGRMTYWTGSDRLTIERHDAVQESGVWKPADVTEQGGPHIGVGWDEPRRFERVVVGFADKVPSPKEVKLQYWHHTWPQAWAGGWTAVDDPFNGKWVAAHGDILREGDSLVFTFDPLDFTEIPQAEDFAVYYRQALKVRLLFKGINPGIKSIEVYSGEEWKEAEIKIEGAEIAKLEIYDGKILSSDPIKVRYIDSTILTVHGDKTFSFLITDALSGMSSPDLGVTVRSTFDVQRSTFGVPIYDRISAEPEQTFERARREIPELIKTRQGPWGRYCPIGCDANRQEFAVRYNADIFADKESMKVVGRDTAKLLWPGAAIWFKFPTGDPPDFREREDGTKQSALSGYLPIYTSEWKDREFAYEMTSFAALLNETPWDEEKKRGDEPMVSLSRVRIRNTTDEKRKARFWLVVENPEELAVDGGFVYATGRARDESVPDAPIQKRWVVEKYPARRMRALVRTNGRGELSPVSCTYPPFEVSAIPNAIAYDIELEPRSSHEIKVFIPFITFTGDAGRAEVQALDYDAKLAEMTEYWETQIGAGAKITVPESLLNDFNRANVAHIAITADKDIGTGLYILGVGTWNYQIFGNETVDQTRSLDLRGYHERARKYIMPFVECQGSRRMDGRFKSQEGALHGVRVSDELDYQVGDYSMDHGTVLWMLGEHYRLTRDAKWLKSISSNIIAACDYVTRERQATMGVEGQWQYGLLPQAHLDDNPEWHYWYVVNTLAYRGMASAGQVLAEIGHSEAARIAEDARAYGGDIRRAIKRSIELAPVVRLLDGTYIPYTPVRCRLRGRDIGWIREGLFGPANFIDSWIIDPNSQEATWILKDFEDNIAVSRALGRQVDLERYWFSQGGLTIQSNLLPNPLVYLARGQVEHALRAFYNSFAANLYADVRCFTEHPVAAYGLGAGPFYKVSDEAAFLNWFRYLLLMEKGNTLLIAPGTPRKWLEDGKEIRVEDAPTYFGPVSFRIVSEVSKGRIHVELQPPKRNPPEKLEIRLRHPDKLPIKSAGEAKFEGETVYLEGQDRIEMDVRY